MKIKLWLWLAAALSISDLPFALAGDVSQLQIVGSISSSTQSVVLLYNPDTKRTSAVSPGGTIPGYPDLRLIEFKNKTVLVADSKGKSIEISKWAGLQETQDRDVATASEANRPTPDKPLVIIDTYKWIRDVGLLKNDQESEMIKDEDLDDSRGSQDVQTTF